MPLRFIALAVLFILGLGLCMGPHPCKAQHSAKHEAAMASCHEATSTNGPAVEKGAHHSDGRDCCGTFCAHACQMPALTAISSTGFAGLPAAEEIAEVPELSLPLLTLSIDHIPLA